MIEIYEDRNEVQSSRAAWADLMTDDQRARGSYYADQYFIRNAEIEDQYKHDWDEIRKMMECKRDAVADDPDFPNSFIPIILPTVEGQVASMMESKIEFRHVTSYPTHKELMIKYDVASEYYRKRSRFQSHFKDFVRDYETYGNAWMYIGWDPGFAKSKTRPNGYPRLQKCELGTVLVDGSIKNSKDLQYARYIIHVIGYMPISWARDEYGDEYADALLAGYNDSDSDDADMSADDTTTFMLLHVWTRQNEHENLQLIEMDANGLIFKESDPAEPYYKHVGNEYPFAIARMIPQAGRFYGIGDGTILRPIQQTINNLTDELELAARFSAQAKLFIDPAARIADGQITSNPADVIFAKDPKNNILPVHGIGINPVIQQMIGYLFEVAQTSTRFHDIMTGNQQGVSATATQINAQVAQGSVGIRDKKTDIAEAMSWVDTYALKVALEKWDRPFWAGLGEDKYSYIDPGEMLTAPATRTVSPGRVRSWLERFMRSDNPKEVKPPKYYEVAEESGQVLYVDVDVETDVIIGEAIPKGSTFMYNMLLGLAQIQVLNKDTGQVEPLITPKRMREAIEELLGMKLRSEGEEDTDDYQEFVQETLLQQNPIGPEPIIQGAQAAGMQPDALTQNVPQMPDGDNRRVQI